MIAHADPLVQIALDEDLCVLRWSDSPGVVQFDIVLRVAQRAAQKQKLAILSVSDAPGKVPNLSAPQLAAGKRMAAGFQHVTKAVAHVILVGGFVGVSVRMIVAGFMAVRRSRSPNHVFSALDDGQRWLVPFGTRADSAARLSALYADAVRAQA